jgi:response regulator RpfG family c-di-GMP phosphodiesterase
MLEKLDKSRTLLLVDDEPNIISALKRTLRRDGYRILTAGCAQDGLNLLVDNDVGVIISDQRMPQVTGVEFLRKVKELYPKTVRLVLSGYTELESVTSAINEGAIYKFLTKPWDDDLLLKNVREAFEYHELEYENQRLTRELQCSNEELFRLNQNLEQQVQQKTRQIMHNMTMLEISQEILEHLPVAIIGIDSNNFIAASNRCADKLFTSQHRRCLLGLQVNEIFPDALMRQLQQPAALDAVELGVNTAQLADGNTVQVWVCPMGESSRSHGTIIVLSPMKAN